MDAIEAALTSLLEFPGARMAALLGTDGVGVQVVLGESWSQVDPAAVEVELAALAETVQRTCARLEAGAPQEFFLETAQAAFVGTMLDPGYFLALGLEPGADLPRARALLAQARSKIEA
jgi:predicted regulator of Ras-like GTPase activity (Roadblock/LC7/MglB family)